MKAIIKNGESGREETTASAQALGARAGPRVWFARPPDRVLAPKQPPVYSASANRELEELRPHLDSASPAEVRLLEATLDTVSIPRAHHRGRPRRHPDRLIADRGYASSAAGQELVRRGIDPIIPCRSSDNTIVTHQVGRKLRRYKRHWKVERSIGWIYNFQRLVVRYERRVAVYAGLLHIACALIALRVVMK